MRVDVAKFQTVFTRRAQKRLAGKVSEASSPPPSDSISLSDTSAPIHAQFKSAVLAMATAASLGGIPALAALAQEVSKDLVTPEQEALDSQKLADQLSALPPAQDQRVQQAWNQVKSLSNSPFAAPKVLQSSFVDAQSDARAMYFGTASLQKDFADDSVLLFTVGHEEGHRVHRDSAGAAGLEALLELGKNDEELFGLAFKALNQGRLENERQADTFAARLLRSSDLDKKKVEQFLAATPGDLQHPEGGERANLVADVWGADRARSASPD